MICRLGLLPYTIILAWCATMGLGLVPEKVRANQVSLESHTIFYSAFPSRLIPPEVAEAHQLRRAKDLMMVNITVQSMREPAEADISGEVINILGQTQTLQFIPVREADALYYLSEVVVDERDWLRFKIRIEIDPELEPYELEFERRFY